MWNPVALVGIVAGLLAWSMAFLIFRAGPGRLQNRLLAMFFLLQGGNVLWSLGFRVLFFGNDTERLVHAMGMSMVMFAAPLMWWAYFGFLTTVDSPVSKWLRRRPVQIAVGLGFAAVALHILIAPEQYIRGLIPWRHTQAWQYDVGPSARYLLLWIPPAVDLLGIVVAVTGLRAAKTAVTRRQFRWYTAAFVTYDVMNIGFYLLLNLEINEQSSSAFTEQFYFALGGTALLALTLLLGYAVLQTQLFDIDLRLKSGLRRTLVATPFAVAFFVLAETLEGVLPIPGYWAGLVGAGLVALVLQPIRTGASHLAERLFPGVEDTKHYRDQRSLDIYQAAVEGAMRDGKIDLVERSVLDRLCAELALSPAEAARIEASLRAA